MISVLNPELIASVLSLHFVFGRDTKLLSQCLSTHVYKRVLVNYWGVGWASVLFRGATSWTFMDLDSISVHKHTKKELGRNPAIVISHLVNNPYNIAVLYFFLCPGLSVSVILDGLDYNQYLGKLLSFLDPVLRSSRRGRLVRCWHAETDGSAASTFHRNCDGKGPTVTIIKSGSYIFGGYTDVSWHSKYHF